jgi:hypothetical protein
MQKKFIFVRLVASPFFFLIFTFCFADKVQAVSCVGVEADLTKHLESQIVSRIDATSPSIGLNIYSYRGEKSYADIPSEDRPWIRNPDSWTQKGVPLDFTGVAGWNDDVADRIPNQNHVHWSPYTGGATLITPRHFVTANHFLLYPGTTVVFFDKEGKPVKRKVVDNYMAGGFWFQDITIGLLDSDVPNSITNYEIIEANELSRLLQGTVARAFQIPITVFNQNAQAFVRKTEDVGVGVSTAIDKKKIGYSGNMAYGDSGQPVFLIINNKPVLLSTNLFLDGSFANFGNYINDINIAISKLNQRNGVTGNYSVKKYDSTCFTKYSLLNTRISLDKSTGQVGDEITIMTTNYVNRYPGSKPNIALTKVGGSSFVLVDEQSRSVFQDNKITFKIPKIDPGLYDVGLEAVTTRIQVLEAVGQSGRTLQGGSSSVPSGGSTSSGSGSIAINTSPAINPVYSPTTEPTPSPTPTPIPTSTPTPTPVVAPTPTAVANPSTSPNPSGSPIARSSPTIVPTPTVVISTPTPTMTPTPTPIQSTPTPSVVATPSSYPTPTPTATTLASNGAGGGGTGTSGGGSRVNIVIPTVATIGSSNSIGSTVILTGSINSTGGEGVVVRGFQYSMTSGYDRFISETGSFGTGRYVLSLSGLPCGSIFRFRAFAKNTAGTTYGEDKALVTASCPLYYPPTTGLSVTSQSSGSSGSSYQGQTDGNTVSQSSGSGGQVNYSSGSGSMGTNSLELSDMMKDVARNLKLGDTGNDVRTLQMVLNSLGYKVADSGPGSPGNETKTFDNNTEQALIRYQTDLSSAGLKPTGILDNVTQILINTDLEKLRSYVEEVATSTSESKQDETIISSVSTLLSLILEKFKNTLQNVGSLLKLK